MLIVTSLPGLVLGLLAGVFVDRFDRRTLMVASEFARTVIIVLVPFLLPFGLFWLYLLVMLNSVINQFFQTAHASILPDVATDQELVAANSFLSISKMSALGLGFAAAGLLIGNFSIDWVFYIDALTFLFSAVMIWLISLPPSETHTDSSVTIIVEQLQGGFRFLFNSPILRSLFVIRIGAALLFGLHSAIFLPFADRVLMVTEFEYGLIEALSMIGFVFGGLFMAKLGERLREGQWLVLSGILTGMIFLIYSQISSVSLAIVLGISSSFTYIPSIIAGRLIVQRNTTRDVRGRVSGAFLVTRNTLFMVGMMAVGLADIFDIRSLIFLEGMGMIFLAVLALIMPGLGQPGGEWKRAIALLRDSGEAPGLRAGRSVTLTDAEGFVAQLPAFGELTLPEWQQIIPQMQYLEAESGTVVVRRYDMSDAAYFLLEGQAVAGWYEGEQERVLETLSAGDFFGEIAAITGMPRTADVVIVDNAILLRVPTSTLREMMNKPALNRLFMSKMTERMIRMNMLDIPRMSELDHELIRHLRHPDSPPAIAP